MRLRLFPLAILVFALPVVASACSPKLASPAAAIIAASQKAESVDSYSFGMDLFVSDPEFGPYRMEIEGALDTRRPAGWARSRYDGYETEWRWIGTTGYVRLDDGSWVIEEDIEVEDATVTPVGEPLAFLAELGLGASDARHLGTETHDGEQWQHFGGTVATGTGGATLDGTFELWVDDDGWARKLVIEAKFDPDWAYDEPSGVASAKTKVTYTFFDYGKPVDVEAPPEDLIVTWEEAYGDDYFGDDWEFEDPFEGADCYGDLLSNCFATNPELDAIAVDPALCQREEARVCLVPVGKVRPDIVQAIIDFHRETAGIEVLVLPGIPITADDVLEETSQIVDTRLWTLMEDHLGIGNLTPSTHIAITEIDVADDPGGYAWMFGSRWGNSFTGHTHGVFSYFRMLHVEPYDGSPITDELIYERVAKYAARYTAILHLKYPMGTDIDYLNYHEMYGFSDLDSMGTKWPDPSTSFLEDGPCMGDEPVICLVGDRDYAWNYLALDDDIEAVAERLSEDLGIAVEIAPGDGWYYPSQASWCEEFGQDLRNSMHPVLGRPNVTIIGVTDDACSQDRSVPVHTDVAWPEERLAVVSVNLYGYAGLDAARERLYRLLYRAVARAHYGLPLSSDPGQLLSDDVTAPYHLDDVALRALN